MSGLATLVLEAERGYARAATGGPHVQSVDPAIAGAVASHYLAVGTPRSFGLITDGDAGATASLAAHATWFNPRDVRCAGSGADRLVADLADPRARVTSLEEALACDIVCVHAAITVVPDQIRRGTHVNVLHAGATISDELARLATVSRETPDLGKLAAGLIDGRQLDEITVFLRDV
jgi:ornithine cyclodeaminase/alanine dehydrogenase-like protein (mu-crystallin family)